MGRGEFLYLFFGRLTKQFDILRHVEGLITVHIAIPYGDNMMEKIRSFLKEIGEKVNIREPIIELLSYPEKVLKAHIPLRKSDGRIEFVKAYRVQYSTLIGPAKGGIRYHPMVNEEEVTLLAFWMTVKNALTGLPFGGGKGGIQVDPKSLNEKEKEYLSREFVRAFHTNLGQDIDVPAPDVYTDSKVMAWMLDEFERVKGKKEPAFITGKPVELGGIGLRKISTSLGGYYIIELLKKDFSTGSRVAVQGFGNVGMHLAEILHRKGYRVVAVSDSKGGIYNEEGLNIDKVIEVKKNTGSVTNYKDGKVISNEELLELNVDILVPAAIEGVINRDNADNINAPVIVELANGPVTPEADEILNERGVLIVPDVLANAGGVIVSYFEWIQGRTGEIWSDEKAKEKLGEIISSAYRNVLNTSRSEGLSLREAAYAVALRRLERAASLRLGL